MDDLKQLYHSLSNANATTTTTPFPPDPILNDPLPLCQTLFDKLHSAFNRFFSALPLRHHDTASPSLPPPHPRLWSIVEDLSLILRCSLLVLTLPISDLNFVFHKCRFLLRVLNAFLSVDSFSVLRFRNFLSDVDLELSDSCHPFLCALLEVFADELLRHQSLRRYLMIADSATSISENLFRCHFNHGDIGSVLEVTCSHFILSVYNEKAFENFISRLFLRCDKDKDFRFPELCLASSTVLLLDPVLLSAPTMFQAHIISLVSEVIGSDLSSGNSTPDMDCYLIAFQKSVHLYSMHMTSLQVDGFDIKLNCAYNLCQLETGQPTIESYIRQNTINKLNQVSSKSDWDSYLCKISSKTKADLLAEYIAFVKERQYIFANSCRDMSMTAPILDSVIHRAFSQDATGDILYNIKENTSAQDICLLASILKLMSVSLLQALKCLSNGGDSGCMKAMACATVREKYDFLISIIKHFQQSKFSLPIQTFLNNVMKSQQTNHEESKTMLLHFSGLLSLCFSNGLDLLSRGCLSVIMALTYLFVFEEGDLVALGSLRGLPLQPCSSEIPSDLERVGDKKSIYELAAKFHRIRTRNLRSDFTTLDNLEEDVSEETSNGEMFLNCISRDPKKLSDYAELADFLECKTGKDYTSWLNDRLMYRKRRYKKLTALRKIKKETLWSSLKGQKNVKSLKRQRIGKLLKHRR